MIDFFPTILHFYVSRQITCYFDNWGEKVYLLKDTAISPHSRAARKFLEL